MKRKLKNILIRILQRLGIYVTLYSSAQRVYYSLHLKPFLIQEYELNKVMEAAVIANNHKFFNTILLKFLPNWNLKIINAKFFNSGLGASSLFAFREIKLEEKTLHEKIYFSSHTDIKRILWFYEEANLLLKNAGISLPPIYKIYAGDALTVVYSEFLDLEKIEASQQEQTLILFTQKLYQLSQKEEFQIISENAPKDIKNFKIHFEYERNRSRAEAVLKEQTISLDNIERSISQSSTILAHGDIQETNAFQNNVLIDWDSVGIFPAGFDPAFLLLYIVLRNKEKDFDVFNWITTNYNKTIDPKEWKAFEFNVVFFLFVFNQKWISHAMYADLNNTLIQYIKKHV
jgi:thiamine kinase-like enzyme